MKVAQSIADKHPTVIRAAKESLNGIDLWDVKRSYRFEQGFTFELNLTGVADELRDDFAGTYHATGGGFTNWHSFAEAIFTESARHGGPRPKVHAITTAEYPTKAKRPADGRLDNGKLSRVFSVALPPWEAGLARVMAALRQG
jgi:hypothetical protein